MTTIKIHWGFLFNLATTTQTRTHLKISGSPMWRLPPLKDPWSHRPAFHLRLSPQLAPHIQDGSQP